MNKLSYYEVSIPYHQATTLELDTIVNRVEYYNDPRHLLFFEGYEENALKFLYLYRQNEPDDNVIDEIREISDIFDNDVSIHECKASELNGLQLRKVKIMRGLCGAYPHIFGENNSRWSTRSRSELLCCLDELIGFGDFKTFFRQLDLYLQNTKGVSGNYNITLINNCGIISRLWFFCSANSAPHIVQNFASFSKGFPQFVQ